jgi:uncharacterized protein (TIRG00374 family)
MQPRTKKWLQFSLRWGVAILGVWFVVKNISLYDQVRIQDPGTGLPVSVTLAEPADENSQAFSIYLPDGSGATEIVQRSQLIARSQYDRLQVFTADGSRQTVDVLGLEIPEDPSVPVDKWAILVSQPRSRLTRFFGWFEGPTWTVDPSRVVTPYKSGLLAYPIKDQGLINVVKTADLPFLWAALLIFPASYLITTIRWRRLLAALAIPITMAKAFQINMVGAFYNTFMPGSTGGDLIKAYYASKYTPNRTHAVLSVIVDRVLGLIALVLLGGTVAAIKGLSSSNWSDPVARKCLQVAAGAAIILIITAVGIAVYYVPVLRRATGLDFILNKLPMQKQVKSAVYVMDIYGKRSRLVLVSLALSFPVHAITVLSAMAAGQAFGLPINPAYYWVIVPVVTLAGSMPLSPQGAGVMEFFAYELMRGQGATLADAVVLTMSLRFVAIFWNLLAGVVVLRGGYHAPSAKEAEELSHEGQLRGGEGGVQSA